MDKTSDAPKTIKKKQNAFEKYSDEELTKAQKFAMLPTGAFGVHDFMLKRNVEGVLHIVISVFIFLFCNDFGVTICKAVGNCDSTNTIELFYTTVQMLGVLFLIGSWVWAFAERDEMMNVIAKRHEPEPPKPTPEEIEEARIEEEKKKKTDRRSMAIASVVIGAIAVAIPLAILLLMLSVCGSGACSEGGGIVFAIPLGFYVYLIQPFLNTLALVFGILSLKGVSKDMIDKKNRRLSIVGICLAAIPLLVLALLFIVQRITMLNMRMPY